MQRQAVIDAHRGPATCCLAAEALLDVVAADDQTVGLDCNRCCVAAVSLTFGHRPSNLPPHPAVVSLMLVPCSPITTQADAARLGGIVRIHLGNESALLRRESWVTNVRTPERGER